MEYSVQCAREKSTDYQHNTLCAISFTIVLIGVAAYLPKKQLPFVMQEVVDLAIAREQKTLN